MVIIARYAVAALAAVLTVAPAAAQAAPGGVRIIVQQWSPANPGVQTNTVALDRPGLLSDALNGGWADARTAVCAALAAEAGKPNRLASGFSLYDIRCAMAPAGTLSVSGLSGNRVALVYTLAGNTFKATSTQPTAAGSYADPCFSVVYDMTAATTLHLDTLAVDAFSVGVQNVGRPDSCNAAGDIAKFAATTLHFFGGPDFLAIAQTAMQRTQNVSTSKLNAAVSSFVTPLRQYASRYATQQSWVKHGDLYFAFAPSYVPQPLTASVLGAIRMPKYAFFTAAPDCGMFALAGTVQTGPAPIIDPEGLAVGSPPTADVGVATLAGPASNAGNAYVCTYVDRQIPAGVPVAYRGGARSAGPSQQGHVQYRVSMTPDGWTGTTVASGPLAGKNFTASVSPVVGGFGETAVAPVKRDLGDPAARIATRTDPSVNQAVTRAGLNPQPLPPKPGDSVTERGNALFARGDFSGAAASYQRAVDADGTNAVALHNLAVAHVRLGQNDRAKGELRRALDAANRQGDAVTARAAETVAGSISH